MCTFNLLAYSSLTALIYIQPLTVGLWILRTMEKSQSKARRSVELQTMSAILGLE